MDFTGGLTFTGGLSVTPQPPPPSSKAIFGYGYITSITNLVSNTGVVATDTAGVGTARGELAAAGYGTDKAIFGFGFAYAWINTTNRVSNTGVVATDGQSAGTGRNILAAAGYGTDKAIFGFGFYYNSGEGSITTNVTNLVSNAGVVANNTTGVGSARNSLAATGYGTDKAMFGYGGGGGPTNLVSNTGVVATDVSRVGTDRALLAAAVYGTDKAIFGYGTGTALFSVTNKVSNTGVVATDTTGVGTARYGLAAAGYGVDTAIFGYGNIDRLNETLPVSMTNLVSNTGVVATDTTGVGTARFKLAAASYGLA